MEEISLWGGGGESSWEETLPSGGGVSKFSAGEEGTSSKENPEQFLVDFKIMLIDNDIKSCALPEAFLEKKMTKKYETPKNYLP